MTNQPPNSQGATKERYEMRRERDVLLLYGTAFRGIHYADTEGSHTPRPSRDSTLTALCQLTAIRLGAQRSMISLLDDHRQHILAEATTELSLRPEAPGDAPSNLWLGNVSIPRTWGLCEEVLSLDPKGAPILVIDDLAEDGRSCCREDVQTNQHMRFYASAALLSPNGAVVGTLCIFDEKPRDGLSKEERTLFKDLASTVVDYLNTYTIKDQYSRGERFTRGLASFARGVPDPMPFGGNQMSELPSSNSMSGEFSSNTGGDVASSEDVKSTPATEGAEDAHETVQTSPNRPLSLASRKRNARSAQHHSIRTLQDSILPADSKSMFSRAANAMMASSDLDGVIILDASVAANGGHRRAKSASGSGTEFPSESYHSRSSSSDGGSSNGIDSMPKDTSTSSSKLCQVLGVATSPHGDKVEYGSLLEPDLTRLFHEYPHGKVLTFNAEGSSLSSTEESPSSSNVSEPLSSSSKTTSRSRTKERPQRGSVAVQSMFKKARSVAFVPFWDYERSRWFAGCLCWSNDPHRLLSASVDLLYLEIFSHSIMRELSRLDAMALNQAKSTFVASISHELRSPLHGILGTLEFIKDTPLDSFQTSMLNSLHACGTTLLDTINHVMDYAKISESKKAISSKRIKNSNTVRLSSKPINSHRKKDPSFDFGVATEEVVEAVFSGLSYIPVSSKLMEAPQSPTDEISDSFLKRKLCYIALDIACEDDWTFSFPIGSWRRIVMNLFGNAVKYTQTGYIQVSLRASRVAQNTGAPTAITLTITDSGSGMSPTFLANKAFQPFSQEDSHAPGTGLGLNIVRQIIDTSGGKIEVSSDPSVGTKLTIKLSLSKLETSSGLTTEHMQFQNILPRLQGRRICILRKKIERPSKDTTVSRTDEGLLKFTNALVSTLENHLKMVVVKTDEWDSHDCDIVIYPELSFEYLAAIRDGRKVSGRRAPVTVFVAMDTLEAATLRSDVRVTNKESVVEITTQPCGPRKLAFVLNRCLDRFDHPSENLDRTTSSSPIPNPELQFMEPQQYSASPFSSVKSSTGSVDVEPPTPPASAAAQSANGSTAAESLANLQHEEDVALSRILITDDNPLNRRLLVAFMRKHGLQYQEASNGLEALKTYQESARGFDIILMDLSMPVMDGMSATRAIREYEQTHKRRPCSIIALTGLASSSAKLEAWSAGIDHFMTKPVNFKALGEILKSEEAKRQDKQKPGLSIRTKPDTKTGSETGK